MDGAESGRPTRVRFGVVAAACAMSIVLYLDRVCVGIAQPYIAEDLQLSTGQLQWFLSAFFWSYALGQVPAGWFSDRYGPRLMLTIYIVAWSLFTAFLGLSAGFISLVVLRLGMGLAQAGAYPTAAVIVSRWTPISSRARASSFVAFGGRLGGAIAPVLTAALIVAILPLAISSYSEGSLLRPGKVVEWCRVVLSGVEPADSKPPSESPQAAISRRLWSLLDDSARQQIRVSAALESPDAASPELQQTLRQLLSNPAFFDDTLFQQVRLQGEARSLANRLGASSTGLSPEETVRLNRLAFEAAYPGVASQVYRFGWRPVMLLYGGISLAVAGWFWLAVRDRPELHPRCNAAERHLIRPESLATASTAAATQPPFPWKVIVQNLSLWGSCGSQFLTNVGWFFLVFSLPAYLAEVHRVSLVQQGWMTMTPVGVGIFGMLIGGWWTDAATRRFGLKWGRRVPLLITRGTAALGYTIPMVLVALVSPETGPKWLPWACVAGFSLVAVSTDLGVAPTWAYCQDVGGKYTGAVLGWGNMWGNLGAAMAPLLYGLVLTSVEGPAAWNALFGLCIGSFVLSGVCALVIDASRPLPIEPETGVA